MIFVLLKLQYAAETNTLQAFNLAMNMCLGRSLTVAPLEVNLFFPH